MENPSLVIHAICDSNTYYVHSDVIFLVIHCWSTLHLNDHSGVVKINAMKSGNRWKIHL